MHPGGYCLFYSILESVQLPIYVRCLTRDKNFVHKYQMLEIVASSAEKRYDLPPNVAVFSLRKIKITRRISIGVRAFRPWT
jgi:hypothetical protein